MQSSLRIDDSMDSLIRNRSLKHLQRVLQFFRMKKKFGNFVCESCRTQVDTVEIQLVWILLTFERNQSGLMSTIQVGRTLPKNGPTHSKGLLPFSSNTTLCNIDVSHD